MKQATPAKSARLADELATAAARYQATHVIPHCAVCAQPCCQLDPLVLELDWPQLKALWQLKQSRTAFDRHLAAGTGPVEIRAMNGRYFAHRKVCPAYDTTQRTCRVYGQALKPVGCTDFPVYTDGEQVIADLRCEAVKIETLVAEIATAATAVGRGFRVVHSADAEFPFLVTLSLRRVAGGR